MEDQELKAAVSLAITESEPCVRELAVTVPAATVDAELNDQLKTAAKLARLPGFRPGKAPLAMVRNYLGKHAAAEAVRRFQGAALLKALEDEKLDLVTYPRPPDDTAELPAGKDHAFKLKVNIAPDFDLPAYRKLKLQPPKDEVDEAAVEQGVARLREMHAEFAKTDEPAAAGDMVKLSYTSDLKLPEGAPRHLARYVDAKDSWLWLSEPELLPGMMAGLAGAKAGEKRPLPISFPKDFRDQELAGKKVEYQIEVLEIQRRKPVTDDAELCKRLNLQDLQQVRASVRGMLERESRQQGRNELHRQVVEQVCGPLREMPLPPALLAEAVEKEFRALANRLIRNEADAEEFNRHQDQRLAEARQAAADRLRQFFVFRRIAKEENIQVSEDELQRQLHGIGQAYGIGEKDLHRRMAETGGIEDLQVDMLMGKVVDFLVAQAADGKKKPAEKSEKTETAEKAK